MSLDQLVHGVAHILSELALNCDRRGERLSNLSELLLVELGRSVPMTGESTDRLHGIGQVAVIEDDLSW